MAMMESPTWEEWIDIHLKMTQWELELDEHPNLGLKETILTQKRDCNTEFSKFVEKNYLNWVNSKTDKPTLSNEIVDKFVIPELSGDKSVFLFVIDCMRMDQWMVMEKYLYEYFKISKDYHY